MTNEEFVGHLMAALHGPMREQIAEAVVDAIGLKLTTRMVAELAMWVLAQEGINAERSKSGRASAVATMRLAATQRGAADGVREVMSEISRSGPMPEEVRATMDLLKVPV